MGNNWGYIKHSVLMPLAGHLVYRRIKFKLQKNREKKLLKPKLSVAQAKENLAARQLNAI